MEPTLAVAVELLATSIDIEGVSYLAYQPDGASFRFVCPAPCTGFSQLMYWQIAGFQAAHERLVQIMGVDVLPELQPVDIHVLADQKCGTLADAPEPSFGGHDPRGNAYVCSFVFEDFTNSPPHARGRPRGFASGSSDRAGSRIPAHHLHRARAAARPGACMTL